MQVDTTPAAPAVEPESALARLLHRPAAAWTILGVSLLLTGVAWFLSHSALQNRARDRFVFRADQVRHEIDQRMLAYEQMLLGGVALFAASREVDRAEWQRYVQTLRIGEFWPGVQGMGFSLRIPAGQLESQLQRVRAEGFAEFAVRPAGPRDEYHPILYIEPFTGRNLRAVGYDMYSEPTRRAAMQRAADTGRTAITGIVTLVQETAQDTQPGFLMYLPVYRNGATVESPQQRQEALLGFVYSPFRVRDLMQGTLGAGQADVGFELYDGTDLSGASLLHRSHPTDPGARPGIDTALQHTTTTEIAGRQWTIRFSPRPGFYENLDSSQPSLVAFGGLCADLMLFYMIGSLGAVRRRAERLAQQRTRELEQSRRHLRASTDHAPDGILTADAQELVIYVNPAAERLFGYPAGGMLGLPIRALRAEALGSQPLLRLVEQDGRRAGTFDLLGRRSDGVEIALEVSIARWQDGAEHYMTAIARDVGDRKEVERLKDEFVTLVSHEMRTPLTTIAAPLALLADGSAGTLPAQARELVAMASLNAARLSRLVADILDAKRMESGRLPVNLGAIELGAFLERAVALNRALTDQHRVECCLEPPGCALWALADADKLMQVLTNLLSNAAKFSAPGAQVGLRVVAARGGLRILVIDRGCGIPLDFRGRIFGKFARAGDADREGVGLGLAISKSLVESMGGAIGFESTVGVGTTFHIELPAAPEAAPARTAVLAEAMS